MKKISYSVSFRFGSNNTGIKSVISFWSQCGILAFCRNWLNRCTISFSDFWKFPYIYIYIYIYIYDTFKTCYVKTSVSFLGHYDQNRFSHIYINPIARTGCYSRLFLAEFYWFEFRVFLFQDWLPFQV